MARFQNACKRTLIFVLLTLGTIFFVPVSALANGVITVTTPLNGATVTVPFDSSASTLGFYSGHQLPPATLLKVAAHVHVTAARMLWPGFKTLANEH